MSDGLDAELRNTYISPLLGDGAAWLDLGRDVDADLATPAGVAAAATALEEAATDGARLVVTVFDVLDGLDDVAPLMEWLVGVADRATVVLSVPWSPNQVEELRRLVPSEIATVVARQVPVRASAIVTDDDPATPPLGAVTLDPAATAAHHLLAFGPDAHRLRPVAAARAADLAAERQRAREQAADLAYLEARVAQLEGAREG
ncbi:MAG TPA: hypothetical protein VFG42_22085 [Baekduia sp.]|uniref:hypothetical protein n=1 Tax=Baekduia sp. TaxID=2600305 RepID=UPI002D76A220|nr:hypothetical protein [Baekduia sp.]HET6509504.1 hypothetical protein [Baekduia sp.]